MAMQEFTKRSFLNPILTHKENLFSSASLVQCYVCGKGLQEGYSITAKTLSSGIVLFCDIHYQSEKNQYC